MATGTIATIGAIAGVTTAAAGVTSAVVSSRNSVAARHSNEDMYQQSMAFNAEEAEKARQYDKSEWDRRFKVESEYNSPVQQVQRLADAGLNAQSLYGDSGFAGQVFGLSSVPSSPAASSPVPPYVQQSTANVADIMNSVANLASASAGAFKNTAEGTSIASTIDGMVKNLELKNTNQALINGAEEIELNIKKSTALKKAWNELSLQFSEIQLKEIMGEYYSEESMLTESQRFLNLVEKELKGEELKRVRAVFPYVVQSAKENVKLIRSERQKNLSEANEADARKNLLETQNKIGEIDLNIKKDDNYKKAFIASMVNTANKLLSERNLSEAERSRVLEIKEQLEKENAWFNFDKVWEKFKDVSDIGLDIFRTVTFQNFFNQESSRKRERDEFERMHYGDVEEFDETHYFDSQGRKHRASAKRKRPSRK